MKRTDYGYAELTSNEIYKFRKDLGMSQAKLSKKLGLSLRTWCHYEYGTQKMPVSVHMALQFLQSEKIFNSIENIKGIGPKTVKIIKDKLDFRVNGSEKSEKVYDNVKKHQDPLTKYDMDRITRLRKSIKDTLESIKDSLDPMSAKIITQSDKEMGFLLSKINN